MTGIMSIPLNGMRGEGAGECVKPLLPHTAAAGYCNMTDVSALQAERFRAMSADEISPAPTRSTPGPCSARLNLGTEWAGALAFEERE